MRVLTLLKLLLFLFTNRLQLYLGIKIKKTSLCEDLSQVQEELDHVNFKSTLIQ
jgi:hypothetical protein